MELLLQCLFIIGVAGIAWNIAFWFSIVRMDKYTFKHYFGTSLALSCGCVATYYMFI